jgi:hypothetical protein
MLFIAKGRARSRVKRDIFLISLFTLLGASTFADIYKWVDEDGKIHFGDIPPQDVESERMQVQPMVFPVHPEGELRRRRLLEQAEKDAARRIEAGRAKAAAERAELEERSAKEQRCREARKQLAVLQEKLPIYRDEEGKLRAKWLRDTYRGERQYLDDAMRTSEIERARRKIATVCQYPDDAEEQDHARKQWIRSEFCAAARAELEALEQPGARASRQTVEEKRQTVKRFCNE